MALTLKEIPDSRQYLGPSLTSCMYSAAAGTSDYVTGGYVINATSVALGHLIGGTVIGGNAASLGYVPEIIVAQTGVLAGLSSVKLQISVTGTASGNPLADAASGANLTGMIWTVQFWGF